MVIKSHCPDGRGQARETMIAPCENAAKAYLPAMKCAIALELYNSHGIKQERIARMLGITQAQVSKYLSHRISKEVEETLSNRALARDAAAIAKKMAGGKASAGEISRLVCKRCADILEHEGCEFSPV